MTKAKGKLTEEKTSPDEAKKIIELAQKKRGEECGKEIDVILNKYRCVLKTITIIDGDQIRTNISVIPQMD